MLSPVKNTLENGHASSPESDSKPVSQNNSKHDSPVSIGEKSDGVKSVNGENVNRQARSHTKLQRKKALPGQ